MATERKTILITGATAGIGRHAAVHFARQGHRVIATGRKTDLLEKVRAEGGSSLEIVRLDVTDAGSIAAAVARVDEITGGAGIDVLVNNAGYGLAGPLEEVSDEDLRAQFDTNVFGLIAVTRAFLPRMRAKGSGRIINVGSMGGRITFPFFGAYHASKYAVEAISDALRRELAPFGIQVALLEPGPIKTEFADRSMGFVHKIQSDRSPFAAIYARAQQIREMSDKQAAGPESVVRAMDHAINARRARSRYVMPFQTKMLLAFMGWLPTRAVDWIMARMVGLTRKNLALPAPAPEKGAAA